MQAKSSEILNSKLFKAAATGVTATLPMTMVMFFIQKTLRNSSQPILPEKVGAEIVLKAAEETNMEISPSVNKSLTWLSHFAFGGIMASMYPLFAKKISSTSLTSPSVKKSVNLRGALFGLGIWFANYGVILPALNIRPPLRKTSRADLLMGLSSHIVWGVLVAAQYHKVKNTNLAT